MKQGATRELFAYWNALRGARSAPERCDIEPVAIRTILADTFMLDVCERFPVRLAGTRAGALLGTERGGGSFLDVWRAEERRNVAAVLLSVADSASPIVVGAAGAPTEDAFELLFLPLRHFGKTHTRLLGLVTAAASSVDRPVRSSLRPIEALAIRSLRVVTAAEMTQAPACPEPATRTAPMLYDALRPTSARADDNLRLGRPIPGHPALRLIEGGRPT